MTLAITIFDGFEDLTGTFAVADIVLALLLAFALSAVVGYVYRMTHSGVSYSQSYVQTLVILGMLVSLIMLVIGSNLARAFSLVGALSIVRFRNAVKETRDVAFLFLAMAIGMATGTRFYSLAGVATVAICGAIVLMDRFDWFRLDVGTHVVKVQVPADEDRTSAIDDVFLRMTDAADLVSIESARGGSINELVYSVRLKRNVLPTSLLQEMRERTGGLRVTVLTGYDRTDI